MWFVVILGIIMFLVMEHPTAFWLVFVPLSVMFVITIIDWLRTGSSRLSGLLSSMTILGVIILALLVVCSN